MIPRSWGFDFLQGGAEKLPHPPDSLRDVLQVCEPRFFQMWSVNYHRCNPGSIYRRRKVVLPDYCLDLGAHVGGRVGAFANNMEGADALAIEAEGLGERLGDYDLHSQVDEVPQAEGVLVEVAGDEPLICRIEKGSDISLFADLGDFYPLILGRVDTARIVGAGVEEQPRPRWYLLQVLNHASKVQATRLLIEVSVLPRLEAHDVEHVLVVHPGRVANVDRCLAKPLDELSEHMQRTRSRDCLSRDQAARGQKTVVVPEKHGCRGLLELRRAIDFDVLFVWF